MDAIFRTVVRLTITRRNLLEWETAAQSEMETKRKTPVDVYLDWTPAVTLVIGGLARRLPPARTSGGLANTGVMAILQAYRAMAGPSFGFGTQRNHRR